MKEKLLIYQGDPCTTALDDPTIQTIQDAQRRGQMLCRYYFRRELCSQPQYGCVRLAGLRVAQCVLRYHNEATEQTLALEIERFCRGGPLPPDQLEGYVDAPEYAAGPITDPALVVQRVADYARRVLDLQPGERVSRNQQDPPLALRQLGKGWQQR